MPATEDGLPVLAGLKAPRMARPLRASALTPAARREDFAIVAGSWRGRYTMRDDASAFGTAEVSCRPIESASSSTMMAMTAMLMVRREQLVALCQKYHVRRLEVFGSAARDDFDDRPSDIDLLIEFEEMPFPDRGDAYLGLLVEAEALLGRPVDLVELGAVRNPYLRQGIEASRQLLYAA
jgi:predicted nucleotidyltransferase